MLKDFVHVAGPLGVTHFVMLTATHNASYLRVAKPPRGPTLTMRVHEYSLIRDVVAAQQRPRIPQARGCWGGGRGQGGRQHSLAFTSACGDVAQGRVRPAAARSSGMLRSKPAELCVAVIKRAQWLCLAPLAADHVAGPAPGGDEQFWWGGAHEAGGGDLPEPLPSHQCADHQAVVLPGEIVVSLHLRLVYKLVPSHQRADHQALLLAGGGVKRLQEQPFRGPTGPTFHLFSAPAQALRLAASSA